MSPFPRQPATPHRSRSVATTSLARLLLGAIPFAAVDAAPSAPAAELANFCADAQAAISGVKVAAINKVHTDFAAFVASKPSVRPLETQQFLSYADVERRMPRMISCKMKTADHVRAEYGADAAGTEGSCASLNERTLASVRAGLSRAERRRARFDRGRAVVSEADVAANSGGEWLQPQRLVYTGTDGALHLSARSLRNDWDDPSKTDRPAPFRGTRYCHLIAPSYLRAILLGEASPETDVPPGAPRPPAVLAPPPWQQPSRPPSGSPPAQ